MLGVPSADYYDGVPGGDLTYTPDGQIYPPQLDTTLDPVGCLQGVGPLQAGQSYCAGSGGQDGTTGDTTDTSSLWSTLGGVAGSFLRSLTGGQGVRITGNAGQVPRPPITQPAVNSSMVIFAGLGVLVLLVLVLRK